MKNIPLFEEPKQIDIQFNLDANLVLYQSDVNDFIFTIPDKSISLAITSPPYNLGKDYEDRISIEKYLDSQEQLIAQLIRTLRDDGSICWQVGNFVEKGELYLLDILYYGIFKKFGLHLRKGSAHSLH